MTASLRAGAAFCVFIALVVFAGAAHPADTITPQAQAMMKVLDAMGVESKWIAGERVYWDTGLPTGVPETSPGKHTHCSAFVAAAAKNLGVYILRPPEHGQKLLANAQNEWLAEEGATGVGSGSPMRAKRKRQPIAGCSWWQATIITMTIGPATSPSCARATRQRIRSPPKGPT
jgi:hypothetical protein